MKLKKSLSALAIALVAVYVASLGCSKSSSASGGNNPYAGTWNVYHTITGATGTCAGQALNVEKGPVALIVTSTGAYSWQITSSGVAADSGSGTVDSSGQVTGITWNIDCGQGPWAGTCSSQSACAGTLSDIGGAFGGQSGTWRMTR